LHLYNSAFYFGAIAPQSPRRHTTTSGGAPTSSTLQHLSIVNGAGLRPSVRRRIAALRNLIRSRVHSTSRHLPGILHVVHGRRGGTEKYVQELIHATRAECRHYLLRITHDSWRVIDLNGAVQATYGFRPGRENAEDDWLAALCSWLRIGLIHVHSLVDGGDDLAPMLERTAIPYCYTVWDMYLPCPTVMLIDSAGVYCNATTDSTACTRCLAKFDGLDKIDIVAWRRRHGAFLRKASKVFAPSRWAGDTLAKYFPEIRIDVSPPRPAHLPQQPQRRASNVFELPDDGSRHIGVLGAIGAEKGARHIEALAQRIRERNLPLRIVVVGYTDRTKWHQAPDRVLTVHGHYEESEVTSLLDHYRIAMLVFPTVWPETFSYTLSEGWNAGRPALVPPVGALEERVSASGGGWIMSGWPDTDAVLDQMLVLTATENAPELERRGRLGAAAAAMEADVPEPMRRHYPEMLAQSRIRGRPIALSRIYRAALQGMGM